ncbi:SRPBCC family protein [Pseudonocardia nematodicida]|uniref:SRPBCC family protein n=1 Tax=Pseudonocardia nematodicida TaxID=1206997 RepID=A0ABV1KIU8_9PSEU
MADEPTTEAACLVPARPRQVWPLVTDLDLLAAVSTEMQRAEWVGAPGPGARIRAEHHHPQRGDWSTESVVTGWEPERVFEWTVEPEQEGGPAAVWRFELVPDGDGTRLRQWARLGPGPSGITEAVALWPDKEERIVAGRLEEWRAAMERNLAAVRQRCTPPQQ